MADHSNKLQHARLYYPQPYALVKSCAVMLALFVLFLSFVVSRVIRVGPGFEFHPDALNAAVAAAVAGDIVELNANEYVVKPDATGVCLPMSRSITLRAASGMRSPPIIRAATADGTEVVIGVGANNVRLENFIIGRPAAGAQQNVDRIVAVLVSAGTQAEPSVFADGTVYGSNAHQKRSSPVGEIHAARELNKRQQPNQGSAPNRVLSGVVLNGIDFTASQSHTNVGFGAGAYVGVRIVQSRFANSADSNSIVTAAGARFESSTVERNTFGGSPSILNGVGLTLGANYWAPALRTDQATFCLDQSCTRFGPVVDGNAPGNVYPDVVSAVIANVQRIMLTVHDVEWSKSADSSACTTITRPGTTIEGVDIQTCTQTTEDDIGLGVSNINLHRYAHDQCRQGAITTLEGALVLMRNVQLTVKDDVAIAIGVLVTLTAEGQQSLLFDHVTMYGHANQVGISLAAPSTRVLLNEVEMFGFSVGIAHHAGHLSIADSVFSGADEVAIRVIGTMRHGLRITDTLFFSKGHAITFNGVKSSSLTEFYVACSRFLFASIQLPSDCSLNSQMCASALRHNTFIVASGSFSDTDRALLGRGANHYEEETIERATQYYKFTDNKQRAQFSFELHDHQGRIDEASGVVTIGGIKTHWAFMMVTHIPMRQECFAATVPSNGNSKGRVVSNLFDLRTDAPSACVSVALRVSLRGSDVDLQPEEDLSIYSVEHVGSASAQWTRAASHTVATEVDGATVAIDASSGNGQLVRAVVVAAHSSVARKSTPEQPKTTPPHVALAVTKSTRQFCVACGADRIPAATVDERCGGGTGQPVFDNIDAALKAVSNAKTGTASLFVYGDKCVTTSCTVELGSMSPNTLVIEGTGPTERGYIRRPGSCAASTSFIRAGAGVTLRYLLIASSVNVASSMPNCAVEAPAKSFAGPKLAYLTVGGGICIGRGRSNTVLLNSEISAANGGRALSIDEGANGCTLEGNVFTNGAVRISSLVSVSNCAFSADAWLEANDGAQLEASFNTFAPRRADATTVQPCLFGVTKSKSVINDNTFGEHCEVRVSGAGHDIKGGSSPWIGVRVMISGASRLSSATLGARSTIQGSSKAILNGVMLTTGALGDVLIGSSVRTSECAVKCEPALAGFDLAQSSVLDANSKQLLPKVWPTDVDSYVSFVDGSIKKCSAGEKSEYCTCLAKGARDRVVPKDVVSVKKQPKGNKKINLPQVVSSSDVCGLCNPSPLINNTECQTASIGAFFELTTNTDGPRCVDVGVCRLTSSVDNAFEIECADDTCTGNTGDPCSCIVCGCLYSTDADGTFGAKNCEPVIPTTPTTTPTPAPTNNTHTTLWLMLGFFGGICLLLCICAACWIVVSRDERIESVPMRTQPTAARQPPPPVVATPPPVEPTKPAASAFDYGVGNSEVRQRKTTK